MNVSLKSGLCFSKKTFNVGKYFKAIVTASVSPGNATIFVNNFTSSTRASDDIITYSMNIYLTDPGGFNGVDPVTFRTGFSNAGPGAFNISHEVAQDTLTSISGTLNIDGTASLFLTDNRFNIVRFNIMSDRPGTDSAVFVKDLVTVHKANDGTIKETRIFNFSGAGDISMLDGNGRFEQPSQATFSKGNFLP